MSSAKDAQDIFKALFLFLPSYKSNADGQEEEVAVSNPEYENCSDI